MEYTYSKKVVINAPVDEVFGWHKRPAAFTRLTPPWVHLKNVTRTGGIDDGATVSFVQKLGPLPLAWNIEHFGYTEGMQFCDKMLSGPFTHYEHHHLFSEKESEQTLLEDQIHYSTMGCLRSFIEKKFNKLFSYRHGITKYDLEHLARYQKKAHRILIAGASGLIGTHLMTFLQAAGYSVDALLRRGSGPLFWDPEKGSISSDALEGYDVIINLCGHPLFSSLWTKKQKERIRTSRIGATRLLVQTIQKLKTPPKVFLSASAIGFYGSCGDASFTEESALGTGFLADVCREWEQTAYLLECIRVVTLRFGLVVSPKGGALALMLPAFRTCLAGPLGSGKQYMSWIGIDDAIRAIHHTIENKSLCGPVNITANAPVTNQEFTKSLAAFLRRPAFLRLPEKALRLFFGELVDETVLSSTRAFPEKLVTSNFSFQHKSLEEALSFYL